MTNFSASFVSCDLDQHPPCGSGRCFRITTHLIQLKLFCLFLFADVVKAHKFLLSLVSDVFKAQFFGELSSKGRMPSPDKKLALNPKIILRLHLCERCLTRRNFKISSLLWSRCVLASTRHLKTL